MLCRQVELKRIMGIPKITRLVLSGYKEAQADTTEPQLSKLCVTK
jgi:hypothetical protein